MPYLLKVGSHIGFAGVRSDGSPISMQQLSDVGNASQLKLAFQDVVRNKSRDAIMSFQYPIYYHLIVPPRKALVILVVPVSPGRTRLFVSAAFALPRLFKRLLPTWLLHFFTIRFIDSDLWIHDQEIAVRNRAHFSSPDLPQRKYNFVGYPFQKL
jgi:hypothetical protein